MINLCFKEDKALFLQHKLESAAVHLRDMENSYLVLPSPKADEEQARYNVINRWYPATARALSRSLPPRSRS